MKIKYEKLYFNPKLDCNKIDVLYEFMKYINDDVKYNNTGPFPLFNIERFIPVYFLTDSSIVIFLQYYRKKQFVISGYFLTRLSI